MEKRFTILNLRKYYIKDLYDNKNNRTLIEENFSPDATEINVEYLCDILNEFEDRLKKLETKPPLDPFDLYNKGF